MAIQQTWEDVDMEEMGKEHASLGRGLPVLKLKVGTNIFRVLPARTGSGSKNPFVKFWVHGIGEGSSFRSFQCPYNTLGASCPVCDKVSALMRTGNEADRQAADRIKAKLEVYCNVIDMKDQDKGVQVLRCAEGTYRDLLGFMVPKSADEPAVNFTNPMTGMNVLIEREGEGKKTKYKTSLSRSGPKPLPDLSVLEKMHDLSKAVRAMPAEQVVALLEGRDTEFPAKQLEAGNGKVSSIADDPDLA